MARYTEWLQKKFVGDPKLGAEYLSLARTLLGGLHNYSKNVMSNVRHVTLPNGVKITVSFAGAINRVLIDAREAIENAVNSVCAFFIRSNPYTSLGISPIVFSANHCGELTATDMVCGKKFIYNAAYLVDTNIQKFFARHFSASYVVSGIGTAYRKCDVTNAIPNADLYTLGISNAFGKKIGFKASGNYILVSDLYDRTPLFKTTVGVHTFPSRILKCNSSGTKCILLNNTGDKLYTLSIDKNQDGTLSFDESLDVLPGVIVPTTTLTWVINTAGERNYCLTSIKTESKQAIAVDFIDDELIVAYLGLINETTEDWGGPFNANIYSDGFFTKRTLYIGDNEFILRERTVVKTYSPYAQANQPEVNMDISDTTRYVIDFDIRVPAVAYYQTTTSANGDAPNYLHYSVQKYSGLYRSGVYNTVHVGTISSYDEYPDWYGFAYLGCSITPYSSPIVGAFSYISASLLNNNFASMSFSGEDSFVAAGLPAQGNPIFFSFRDNSAFAAASVYELCDTATDVTKIMLGLSPSDALPVAPTGRAYTALSVCTFEEI